VRAGGPVQRWVRFWFTPRAPGGLHAVRLLTGLLLAFWLVVFAGYQEAFFGLDGWFDVQAFRDAARMPGGAPAPLGWSVLYLVGHDAALLNVVYWSAIVIFLLFAAGVAPRLTGVLSWVLVVSFTANPAISYDADHLLVILAFYLMIGYILYGQWTRSLSPAGRILGTGDESVLALVRAGADTDNEAPPSYAANLAIRLLQVHFAIVIVTAALHKLQYGDWWSGVAFWYPLTPPLETTQQGLRTSYVTWQAQLILMSLAQYAVLIWQLAFPLFAWRSGWWRAVLIGGSVLGWFGCLFIFGLPLFGPIFVIASLTYLTPDEWRAGFEWLRGSAKSLSGGVNAPHRAAAKSTKVGT
jgi:hypothetical protein